MMDAGDLPGVSFGQPRIDLDAIRREKDKVVERLTKGLTSLAGSRKVQMKRGIAAFISPNSVSIRVNAERGLFNSIMR